MVINPETKQPMTDEQIEAWIAEMRSKYAAGELPEWKIKRLNQIEGWTWEQPEASESIASSEKPQSNQPRAIAKAVVSRR